jgi:hypothetical protein
MNAAVAAFAKRSFLATGYYARRLRSDSFPGVATRPGFATPHEPALEHSRFVMLRGVSAAELGHRLAHSWRD